MLFKPHSYQVDSIEFLHNNPCAALFADPGLGKTSTVLSLIDQLYLYENTKTLIIAPLRVIYSVWPEEIEKWNQFKYLEYTILHGKDKEKNLKKDLDIYLINVENAIWLLNEIGLDDFDILVIDESSKFKSHKSKRFKALKPILEHFKRRIILTGTPMPNTLLDLWSQIYIVDKGEALGAKITHYKERFFNHNMYRGFHEWKIKQGAEEKIQELIKPLVMRIEAADYLDLPDIIYNTVKVTLPNAARKIYKQIETYLFMELDGEELTLPSASSAYNACHQIANGSIYRPTQLLERLVPAAKRKVVQLHSEKIKALEEILGELQGKSVLIAYHYKHDLKTLQKFFGEKVPNIGGGVSSKEGKKLIDKWNKGKLPVLLGHPQSISHGLNLQSGGSDIIWFSLTDDLEAYLQFIRRIYRQGQTNQVRVHHIIAEDTVDLAIMARLESKEKSQTALLKALKGYRDEKDN
jgi:SNF2 family DNA or RNA helicase